MYMLDTLADVLGFTLVFSILFLFPIGLGLYAAYKTVERLIQGPSSADDQFIHRRPREHRRSLRIHPPVAPHAEESRQRRAA